MASFKDLQLDWSMLCTENDNWTEADLQLAAELGKTLLERNKELETALKQHQVVIEDQAQEIEYLTKQTVALREVNDSRLRIYEQLEVSIQDLERANHRLVLDNSAEKKHVKSLNATIESLESKCEELQSTIDDLNLQVDLARRRNNRTNDLTPTAPSREFISLRRVDRSDDNEVLSPDSSVQTVEACSNETNRPTAINSTPIHPHSRDEPDRCDPDSCGVEQLAAQLARARALCGREERRIAELEEQLAAMVQQNQALERQVAQATHRSDDLNMKSMHEELTTLDEVRRGQMCSRCLRSLDTSGDMPDEDDDDSSMMDELMTSPQSQHRASFSMDVQAYANNQSSPVTPKQPNNPYKELVQKYEALVKVNHHKPAKTSPRSLQEELQMSGEFKDSDNRKALSTPTDFSEAETSSSGFADETSNKSTQTEGRAGAFLCTIADGADCRFSIYDDASPIDSRFKDRPEYRDLFREIFGVLKKAAEEEEKPVVEESAAVDWKDAESTASVAAADEEEEDSQSVVSLASELSAAAAATENRPPQPSQPLLRPLVRRPLEYLSVEVRKRSSSRRKGKPTSERSDSSATTTHIIGSPKVSYSNRPNSGRKRREQARNGAPAPEGAWNGHTVQFWATSRGAPSPTPSQGSATYEFRPSTASQDLHKLKRLDMSYAEVLRNAGQVPREGGRPRRK